MASLCITLDRGGDAGDRRCVLSYFLAGAQPANSSLLSSEMDQSTTPQADESSQTHWKKRSRSSEEAEHHGNSCSSLSGQTDGHDGQKEKGSDAVTHRRQQRRLSSDNDVSILRDRKIKRLRLEAIFHPKFENESSEKDVRKEMMEKVEKGDGYLEVTLKHSGSLLLW
jgi:hypothetical protein